MGVDRIAVCTWSLRPAAPREIVERVRAAGLRRVQLGLSPIVDDPAVWGPTIGVVRGAGLEIASGMMALAGEDYSTLETIVRTGGLVPDERWPANRAHAEAVAALAADAGIGLVTFHAGFIPETPGDPRRATLIDRLRVVADAFAVRDVALALETGQETAAALAAALDEVDRPGVGVNFDPANMILYGKGDPVDALARLAPRVHQIHVKDALPTTTPGTWGTEVPAGEGTVDWPAFFSVAREIAPPVDFVIEREAGADRVDDIIAARALITRWIDRSGS